MQYVESRVDGIGIIAVLLSSSCSTKNIYNHNCVQNGGW
jgi:hypothetical protein